MTNKHRDVKAVFVLTEDLDLILKLRGAKTRQCLIWSIDARELKSQENIYSEYIPDFLYRFALGRKPFVTGSLLMPVRNALYAWLYTVTLIKENDTLSTKYFVKTKQ